MGGLWGRVKFPACEAKQKRQANFSACRSVLKLLLYYWTGAATASSALMKPKPSVTE